MYFGMNIDMRRMFNEEYTDSRWNNTTFPTIISQRELTEEEKDCLTQNSKSS